MYFLRIINTAVIFLIFLFPMQNASALEIELKNGSTLIINSFKLPSEVFADNIERLYENNVRQQNCEKEHSKTLSIRLQTGAENKSSVKYCPYKDYDFSEFWNSYYNLNEDEKEKIYLPLLKQNERYFTAYQKLLKKREAGVYAKIYDRKNDTLINTAERKIQQYICGYEILDDGRVLFIYNTFYNGSPNRIASKFEIYDPLKNKFIIIPNKNNIRISGSAKLKNNKCLFLYNSVIKNENGIYDNNKFGIFNTKTMHLEINDISKGNPLFYADTLPDKKVMFINLKNKEILIYNPENNTFFQTKKYFSENTYSIYCVRADSGIIYIIVNKNDKMPYKYVFKYDYTNNELVKLGELLKHRSGSDVFIRLLQNGNLLIIGGNRTCYFDGSCSKENRFEIFNTKTGKSHYVKKNEKIPNVVKIEKKS